MTTKEIWVGVDWGKEEKKKQTNQMDEGVSFHAQFTRVLFLTQAADFSSECNYLKFTYLL